MTNKEAKRYLECAIGDGSMEFVMQPIKTEVIEKAVCALEKEQKYRWHDLRKNPNDLPESNADMCLCAFNFLEGVKEPFYDTVEKFKVKAGVILAWKEIEPFEAIDWSKDE